MAAGVAVLLDVANESATNLDDVTVGQVSNACRPELTATVALDRLRGLLGKRCGGGNRIRGDWQTMPGHPEHPAEEDEQGGACQDRCPADKQGIMLAAIRALCRSTRLYRHAKLALIRGRRIVDDDGDVHTVQPEVTCAGRAGEHPDAG